MPVTCRDRIRQMSEPIVSRSHIDGVLNSKSVEGSPPLYRFIFYLTCQAYPFWLSSPVGSRTATSTWPDAQTHTRPGPTIVDSFEPWRRPLDYNFDTRVVNCANGDSLARKMLIQVIPSRKPQECIDIHGSLRAALSHRD